MYIGWHGRDNIGDDAIFDAVQSQLPGVRLDDLPHYGASAVLSAFSPKFRGSPLVLGGGTVVGRSSWRRVVARGLKISGASPGFALGVGVEDPEFQGIASCSGNDELRRWISVLRRFRSVSVRGPRSAELLADAGYDAKISGDPALMLPPPDAAPEEGVIGLNMGFGDDLWGHDPHRVAEAVSIALRTLSKRGHRLVGVLMNPDDEIWTRRAFDGIADSRVVVPNNPAQAAQLFSSCTTVIACRLHAGILAALSATPVVALEYQPKCRDFARSIGNDEYLLRTDVFSADDVVQLVASSIENQESIRSRTRERVDELRRRLFDDYATVRSVLGD
ncbi:polysaccharide pyruvyl transferase family protein [Mycolicibacterium moriokaense]|nr:polysaccharide pyruvyl transferase family protein [Mycolicibacterium moriokaense]